MFPMDRKDGAVISFKFRQCFSHITVDIHHNRTIYYFCFCILNQCWECWILVIGYCEILMEGKIRVDFLYKSEKCFSNYFTCRDNVTHKTIVGMGIYKAKNMRARTCFVLKAMEALPCWITQFSVQSTESRVTAPSWGKVSINTRT